MLVERRVGGGGGVVGVFFFFKQKTAYEIGTGDWSQTCALPICQKAKFYRLQASLVPADVCDILGALNAGRYDGTPGDCPGGVKEGIPLIIRILNSTIFKSDVRPQDIRPKKIGTQA